MLLFYNSSSLLPICQGYLPVILKLHAILVVLQNHCLCHRLIVSFRLHFTMRQVISTVILSCGSWRQFKPHFVAWLYSYLMRILHPLSYSRNCYIAVQMQPVAENLDLVCLKHCLEQVWHEDFVTAIRYFAPNLGNTWILASCQSHWFRRSLCDFRRELQHFRPTKFSNYLVFLITYQWIFAVINIMRCACALPLDNFKFFGFFLHSVFIQHNFLFWYFVNTVYCFFFWISFLWLLLVSDCKTFLWFSLSFIITEIVFHKGIRKLILCNGHG